MYGHFGNQPLIAILICIITLIAKKILNFSHQNTKTSDIPPKNPQAFRIKKSAITKGRNLLKNVSLECLKINAMASK